MPKPIFLHSHPAGGNPWKVVLLLKELGLPYEYKYWDFPDLKTPPYEKINPNGRVPSIEDPNTGITLWESGAILEYLIETYDTKQKFTYTSSPEKFRLKQWLHFQVSGQGPYFGQLVWFSRYHSEQLPSAVERYAKEVNRVVGVVDRHLTATGGEYLVGDKYTYADLAFIPWFDIIVGVFENDREAVEKEWAGKYPAFGGWWQRIKDRAVTREVLGLKAEATAEWTAKNKA